MKAYREEEKDLLQTALKDDLEILLEEFEEATGRQVYRISITRVDCDEKKFHRAFEYAVEIKVSDK